MVGMNKTAIEFVSDDGKFCLSVEPEDCFEAIINQIASNLTDAEVTKFADMMDYVIAAAESDVLRAWAERRYELMTNGADPGCINTEYKYAAIYRDEILRFAESIAKLRITEAAERKAEYEEFDRLNPSRTPPKYKAKGKLVAQT